VNDMTEILSGIASLQASVQHLQRSIDDVRSLVGPFATSFPDGTMLVQTLYGTKYFIDPSDEVMAPQLVVYRQWEADLSQFMINSVTPDTVFMDVGANFGYFTCLVASRIGCSGRGAVIAVEPNPRMVTLLERNIRINWSIAPVEVYACAVADSNGYLEFNVPEGRAANAGLATGNQPAAAGDRRFIVPTKTLGDIASARKVDLMKIDVEGFELAVLKHIGPVLANSPALSIVMEWSPSQMKSAGFSVDDFLAVLDKHRLAPFRVPPTRFLDPAELAQFAITGDQLRGMAYDNILLTPQP